MTQSNIRIGNLIATIDERNTNRLDLSVLGVNKTKSFMPTAANLEDVDTTKYKIIRSGMFVFSGMQTGRDECIRIALYQNHHPSLVSPAYTVFKIVADANVLPEYFYLYFNREESDRYGAFLSDSSVRANLDWDRFVDIIIPLPSLAEQQKVVNAWKALREIKEQNEAIAAPLMQVCQSYIQDLKHKYESVEIGQFIEEFDIRNMENESIPVLGINVTKDFMPTVASLDGTNLKNYKVIKKGQFVFSGMQTGRDVCIRTGMYKGDNIALVSPAYTTYIISNTKCLHPVYFDLMFKRKEMDRLGAFYSDASVRANLEWRRFNEIKIPLPPLEVQQSIVNLYNCANEAKKIAVETDRMSREVCPALIQHVINN